MNKNRKFIVIAAIVTVIICALIKSISIESPNDSGSSSEIISQSESQASVESDDNSDNTDKSSFWDSSDINENKTVYRFRNERLLEQHFEKHGKDMGYESAEEYEAAASDVINDPNALQKTEKEDGDFVYYLEDSNEFVILSTDGFIRTYFNPNDGKEYFDRQ